MKILLKNQSHFVILLFLSVLFSVENSMATNPYQVFKKDRIDFNLTTNFFKSQANFASDGSQQTLPGDNYFQNIEINPNVRWELIEDIGFITGVNIASSESSDPLTTRKNSIINRIDLGADYLFWNSQIYEAFFRFTYSHPLEKTDLNTDAVSNSDGASEIKPELVIRFNLDGIYPYVQGGLNYRSEGLSMLATYAAGIEARFSEIGLGAAVIGRASITDDNKTNAPAVRDAVNDRVNAGSKKYFSINPNSTDLELSMNYAASNDLLFKVFGGYTLLGSNSAVGYNLGVGLNFNFGTQPEPRKHKEKTKQQSTENLNTISREPTPTDFKEDTNDGVNQEYFKPIAPAQKNYIKQVDGGSQNLQNATTADQPADEDIQIKKKLNAMEYTIKLKKAKKKKAN